MASLSENPPANSEPCEPVVIITDEDMKSFREEQREKRKDPNALVSPFGDVSVQGYPADKPPNRNGASEVKEITDMLRDASIPCCLVAEAALIYYGAGRILHDWHVCVPTARLERARGLFTARTERFESFGPSAMTYTGNIDYLCPRFKFVGLRLFFVLMPSYACHLEVIPENIEFSNIGLPYPTLPVYGQSLLDGKRGVDLDDLIDGMDLTVEWGEQHLDLEGTIDADWIWWRYNAARHRPANKDAMPAWYSNPDRRRDIWAKKSTTDAKKLRQAHKYQPDKATRFRAIGSIDPRLRNRDYC